MRLDNPSISGSISYLGGGTNTISGTDAKITGSFTGSFIGAVSGTSSIATTASYIELSNVDGSASLASRITSNSSSIASLESVSGSYANSASFASDISTNSSSIASLEAISGSYANSASFASDISINSASIASLETISGSYANSASFASDISANSASIGSLNAVSSSYLLNTTDTLTGDLTVTGNIIATTLNVQDVTASVVYSSGSNIFGSSSIDTQQFTGSILTTGSIEVTGPITSGAIVSSASITAAGNSNSFGNTTIAALSASTGTFSASVTAAGNSNSFGATTFTGTITSTSTSTNTLAGKLRINGTTTTGLEIASSSGSSSGLKLYNDSSNDHAYILNNYNGNLALGTNNAAVITLNGTTATFAGNIAGVGASFIGTASSGAALVTIENNSGSTATSYGLLVIGGGNSSNGRTFEVRDASGNSDLIVKGNGNVGIGTDSPSTKLHLGGTAPGDSIIRQDSTASGTNWEIGERVSR